jgi:hypothetical protein
MGEGGEQFNLDVCAANSGHSYWVPLLVQAAQGTKK